MVERSFAGELASLLGATSVSQKRSNAAETPDDASVEIPTKISEIPEIPDISGAADVSPVSANAGFYEAGAISDLAQDIETTTDSVISVAAARSVNNSNDDASAADLQPIVVHAPRTSTDRVVPITRLPLRPQSREITWFASLAEKTRLSASERHSLLEGLLDNRERAAIGMLTQAYHEEDAQGRVLALLWLASHHAREARGTFVDALHNGTDDERVVAVDALAKAESRGELPAAFNDRVDAIAARAALAYVGTNVREDYVRALEPHVDPVRIEVILALLAGLVE